MAFTVDGFEWDIPCTIERTAEVKASEISGMMMDKRYFNDVLGTYLKYTVAIAIPKGWENVYTGIYTILAQPQGFHTFTFPYNEDEVNITGRVETISDSWVRLPNGKQTWRKTTFEVISNVPTFEDTLEGAIARGLSPYPVAPEAQEGDLYEYSNGTWIRRYYANADEVYY